MFRTCEGEGKGDGNGFSIVFALLITREEGR